MPRWQRNRDYKSKKFIALAGVTLAVGALGISLLIPSFAANDGSWASGASYYSSIGGYSSWRGSPGTIYGCWADARDSAATQSSASGCMGQAASAGYKYDVDLAVGFIVNGESMSGAANGSYDGRWRTMAQSIRANWGQHRTVYIRPAHEMNGNWYPWSVTNGNVADFRRAFIRYSNIIKTELKDKGYNAKVTLSYNWDSNPSGVSIDAIWPGDEYVDVVGVDRYDVNWNSSPPNANDTEAEWNNVLTFNNKAGNYGLNNWLAFAKAHGKPVGFPEWGLSDKSLSGSGDNPFWIQKMHDFFAANAGSGPGQVIFDVYFNVGGYGGWVQLYPSTGSPNAANRYKSLKWGSGGTINPNPTPTPTPTPPTPPGPTPTPPTPTPPTQSGQISQVDNIAAVRPSWQVLAIMPKNQETHRLKLTTPMRPHAGYQAPSIM
jgi:Glycosyl hydrolase family 26